MGKTQDLQGRVARIDELVRKVEAACDPALRSDVRELIETLMDLHGAGLERILEILSNAGETAAGLIQSLSRDELISSLLVLYGIHPEDFESRVRRAVDNVRPQLRSQGARLELIAMAEGSVRVRIIGAASRDLEELVRAALFATAPDAAEVVIEGTATNGSSFVPLESLRSADGSPLVVPSLSLS